MDMAQNTSLKVHFVGKSWKVALFCRRGGLVQIVFFKSNKENNAWFHQYSTGDLWGC